MKSYPSSELRNMCDEHAVPEEPAEKEDLLQQMLERRCGCSTGAGKAPGGHAGCPCLAVLGSVWFLCNRYTPYPNLYPDQSPSEDWTMEERFRPLTFHGLVLRSQLVTLLVRGVCYSESQSVRLGAHSPVLLPGALDGRFSRASVPTGCCQMPHAAFCPLCCICATSRDLRHGEPSSLQSVFLPP